MNSIEQLLALNDETFVRASYDQFLAREPDALQLRETMRRLAAGETRLSVLYELGVSEEGRRRRQALDPSPQQVVDAAAGQDHEGFVKAAYLQLLGREADPGGLENYVGLLQGGRTRLQVAQDLHGSEEGSNWRAVVARFLRDLDDLLALETGARKFTGWWERHERLHRSFGLLEARLEKNFHQLAQKIDRAMVTPRPAALDGRVMDEPAYRASRGRIVRLSATGRPVPLAPEAEHLHRQLQHLTRAWNAGERGG